MNRQNPFIGMKQRACPEPELQSTEKGKQDHAGAPSFIISEMLMSSRLHSQHRASGVFFFLFRQDLQAWAKAKCTCEDREEASFPNCGLSESQCLRLCFV